MPMIKTPKRYICPASGRLMDEPSYWIDRKIYSMKAIISRLAIRELNSKETMNKWVELEVIKRSNEHKDFGGRLKSLKNEIDNFIEENKICTFKDFWEAIEEEDFEKLKQLNYLDVYSTGDYYGYNELPDETKDGYKKYIKNKYKKFENWLKEQEKIAEDKDQSNSKSPLQNHSHFGNKQTSSYDLNNSNRIQKPEISRP